MKRISKTPRRTETAIIKTLATGVLLVLAGMLSLQVLAEDVISGKKGQVHFQTDVKAGDTVLKPGMYQVQHLEEGGDHVIVFKGVGMAAGYRMGNTPVGKEVARLKCKVEPVTNKLSNTTVTLRSNSAGEEEIAEVQISGETFKYLM